MLAVVGPTASGKTAIAIHLAQRFHGEILVADSRQVYRGMDIGTNKVRRTWDRERRTDTVEDIPYYGIDLVEPNESFTVREWKAYAQEKIREIAERGMVPIIEGGTGLYVTALLENLEIPEVPPNPTLRAELEERMRTEGLRSLIEEISEKDPDALAFLDTENPRRVIRALEVIRTTNRPFSAQRTKGPRPYRDLRIGIERTREELDRRIEERARAQFEAGLEEEVRRLIERLAASVGRTAVWEIPAMSGIGYGEWRDFFEGRIGKEEVLSRNIRRNRRLAAAQRKWFLRDPTIRWVRSKEEAERLAASFLGYR